MLTIQTSETKLGAAAFTFYATHLANTCRKRLQHHRLCSKSYTFSFLLSVHSAAALTKNILFVKYAYCGILHYHIRAKKHQAIGPVDECLCCCSVSCTVGTCRPLLAASWPFEHIESVAEAVGKRYHSGCSANWISPWEETQKKWGKVLFCTFLSHCHCPSAICNFLSNIFLDVAKLVRVVSKNETALYIRSQDSSLPLPGGMKRYFFSSRWASAVFAVCSWSAFFFGPETGDLRRHPSLLSCWLIFLQCSRWGSE